MKDQTKEFEQETEENAKELAATAMGKMMLGTIAQIYKLKAKQKLGGLKSFSASIQQTSFEMKQKKAVASSLLSTY